MISIVEASKSYGNKRAVSDLNIELKAGELFAFLGPNGAGKTTTIKMIAGLLKPDKGRITIRGCDVQKSYVEAKSLISYVPDQPYVYDKLSGRELLYFIGRMYGLDKTAVREKTADLSKIFELTDFIDDLCESYSHGMKQRLVISAALIHDPAVILIDEPMVGLDPKSADLVKKILKQKTASGSTVFLSTHTLSVAEEIADRIGIINKSRLISLGTLDELRASAQTNGRLEEAFLRITDPEYHENSVQEKRI